MAEEKFATAPLSFDALLPPQMAARAEDVGLSKISLSPLRQLALAMLAGAFIAMGAVFSTTTVVGAAGLPFGVQRLLAGLTFSLGLIIVVVGGAELFTGNVLIIMAYANRKVRLGQLVGNWVTVYLGNFIGALATVILMFFSQQYTFAQGQVGLTALNIAHFKCTLGFWPALVLGIYCNALVCLAVWLCFSARSSTDRILSIIPPITAFVACGFEHSIANMYFIPIALAIKAWAPLSFWALVQKSAAEFPALTWTNFLVGNLLPVTLGNILGGGLLVGGMYWFIYLRPSWRGKLFGLEVKD
ncbi:MAG: formate transporter FocA [Desulfobaccales bacterium]